MKAEELVKDGLTKSDEKKLAILRAAEVEFARKGFEGTTIQSIADRACMTKRQVVYFFKNKRNIYTAVVRRVLHVWHSEELDMWPGTPIEIFEGYIDHIMVVAQRNPTHSKFLVSEMLSGGDEFRAHKNRDEISAATERRLRRMQEWMGEGRIRSDLDPIFFLFLIWSMQHFFTVFEPLVAFFFDKKNLDEDDWVRISKHMKQIFRIVLLPDSVDQNTNKQ